MRNWRSPRRTPREFAAAFTPAAVVNPTFWTELEELRVAWLQQDPRWQFNVIYRNPVHNRFHVAGSVVVTWRWARTILALLLAIGALAPLRAAAQDPDSLVGLLQSPNWRTRSVAVARLNQLPVAALPSEFAPTAIALLEREATAPDPQIGRGEGYGEYHPARAP